MTDLLTRDEPSDTGEIPRPVGEKTLRIVGEATQRLNPMIATAPFPALRRSDATGEIPHYNVGGLINGGCRTVVPNDEDFVRPGQPVAPAPEPTPAPAPPVEPEPEAYVGRHRRSDDLPAEVPPGRFGALRSVLASAWARVRRSM